MKKSYLKGVLDAFYVVVVPTLAYVFGTFLKNEVRTYSTVRTLQLVCNFFTFQPAQGVPKLNFRSYRRKEPSVTNVQPFFVSNLRSAVCKPEPSSAVA